MALMGVDIAWATPDASTIAATGAHFVARYFSPDSSKNITADEVRDYPAHGLSIVVVYESTANRMLGGRAAGVSDAQMAESQRRAVGLPDDTVIYFACDFDAVGSQYSTVNDYMRGVNSVIGLNRSGFYGGYYTVENVAAAPATASYFWQAEAWSNGHWSGHANIRQDGGTLLAGSADVDHSMTDDFGQYPRPSAPVVPPAPPAQKPLFQTGDEMAIGYLPTGFGADKNGFLSDRTKAVIIPLPQLGGTRWPYQMVDLSLACDFTNASEFVKLRVAIHGAGGWRVGYATLKAADGRMNVWLQNGDTKASICRVPTSDSDTTSGTVPVSWMVETLIQH